MPTSTCWKSRMAILWLRSAAGASGRNTRTRLTTGITVPRSVNTPSRNGGDSGSAVILLGKLTTSRMALAGSANSSAPNRKEPNSSMAGGADGAAVALASDVCISVLRRHGDDVGDRKALVGAIDIQLPAGFAAELAIPDVQAALLQIFLRRRDVLLADLQPRRARAEHAGAAGQDHFDVRIIALAHAHQAQQRRHGLA